MAVIFLFMVILAHSPNQQDQDDAVERERNAAASRLREACERYEQQMQVRPAGLSFQAWCVCGARAHRYPHTDTHIYTHARTHVHMATTFCTGITPVTALNNPGSALAFGE